MDPFFSLNYRPPQSQSIPQEGTYASVAIGRSPTNHLSQNLASLSLDGSNSSPIDDQMYMPREGGGGGGNNSGGNGGGEGGGGGGGMESFFHKVVNNNGGFSLRGADPSATSPQNSRDSTPVPPTASMPAYQHNWIDQENVGGTTYFYNPEDGGGGGEVSEEDQSPYLYPQFSAYPGPASHLKEYTTRLSAPGPPPNPVVHPNTQTNGFYVPDEMKMEILHKNAVTLSQPNPTIYPELPPQIDHYHDICPLESHIQKSVTFSYPTSTYKAVNLKNGFIYCLRRIHGFRLPAGKWLSLVEAWKQMSHCNLVQLREIFTTKVFGDNSLIFVYDYFPSADSLMARHFDKNNGVNGYVDPFSSDPAVPRPYSHKKNALLRHHANMLPENLLWAYIVQLSSVIRTIHTAGLAVRSLDPTKILVTSRTRPTIRLNCCGIYDIVTWDPNANPLTLAPFYQQEDLHSLGKLILALACNSLLAVQRENLSTSIELISRTYSSDLRNLIAYLMNPRGTGNRSINDIMPMIGARFYNQLDSANARAELLEHCLAKEIENGRLFRIVAKLCTVVERCDMNLDPSWSETGDRYLLKLFRDYVFHQVSADGRPWLDMSHIVYSLNRLDAGAPEKVCLMSRDEQSILITTYGELKHCMEQSFAEILAASTPPPPPQTPNSLKPTLSPSSGPPPNHLAQSIQ